ncbi:hypothetical protein C7437_102417 [Psychrobacillus insolitus]|uniref:Uncharacterized protein n=1 Tax=Psychrobacillus insolitus TaxID=1461 RepID=A0A2W7N7P0_9BACI|nr:hypothetical protein [Psychrobacillus insolitus]PZX05950.1 hypothetical protein C7437_102417 [Psychrobacillus insolitus]
MVISTFNHIKGSKGSHWNRLMRGENANQICIVAIDAAKFMHSVNKDIEKSQLCQV